MKNPNTIKQNLNVLIAMLFAGFVILTTTGCDEVDGGTVRNTVQLPADSTLSFFCADEGVYVERCVLDNPDNPYRNVAITEPLDEEAKCAELYDPTSKFTLSDDAPSAKAKYYVWASALAKGVGLQGENQYFTALQLHYVYSEKKSPTTREQALKAYRSLLDNYFLSTTFDKYAVMPDPDCPAFDIEVKVAASLKDRVGANLYDPKAADPLLEPLFDLPDYAQQELGEWGYIYTPDTGILSIYQ